MGYRPSPPETSTNFRDLPQTSGRRTSSFRLIPYAGVTPASSNLSLSVSGRPSALDRFRSVNALSFEVILTHRLNREARASIRASGCGNELLDIAFNADM